MVEGGSGSSRRRVLVAEALLGRREEAAAGRVWSERSCGAYIVTNSATWRTRGCLGGKVAGLISGPR
jgi:hypothetical protein